MFLVLKLQRTGSSLFSAVLNSHPDVNCWPEILNKARDDPKKVQMSLMAKFLSGQPCRVPDKNSNNARTVFGATLNPFKHNLSCADLISAFEKQPEKLSVICLTRSNKLKQAVSILIAEQFSWRSSLTQFISPLEVRAKRVFDVQRLKKMVLGLELQSKQLRAMAHRVSSSTLDIEYESIYRNFDAAFSDVFDHLGLPHVVSGFDYPPGFQKILPDDIENIVINLDEIQSDRLLATYL